MSSPSRPDRCSRKLLFPFSNYVTPSGKSGTVLYLLCRFSAGQLNVSVDTGLFYDYKRARGILTYKTVSCQKGQTLQWQHRKTNKVPALYHFTCVLCILSMQILLTLYIYVHVCLSSVDKDELVKYTTVVDPNVNKEVYPLSKYVRAAIVFLTLRDVVKFN